ncbi:hypothetical protein Droror1_Dr00018849 [Drosera rotundifolia]
MIRELETISYQESFHGAFSSANAALSLIAQRIEENHLRISTKADKLDAPILENETQIGLQAEGETSIKLDGNVDSGVSAASSSVSPALEKNLKKVVNKAAATFAPRPPWPQRILLSLELLYIRYSKFRAMHQCYWEEFSLSI